MEIFANKGCFAPDEPIELTILCDEEVTSFCITVTSLHTVQGTYDFPYEGRMTVVTLPPMNTLFAGFGVICRSNTGEEARCAFDVQGARKVFRYGFLSDFTPQDDNDADVLAMTKHHVNAVQFYDWSYRHDTLVAPTDDYTDMMGKRNSLPVIRRKINACHQRGMKAIGYGAVYAASESFATAHNDWRLFTDRGPLKFIDVFSIMNVRTPWKGHLIEQYRRTMTEAGFDGIHMDTYGFPKTAWDSQGSVVHLEEDFPRLIEDTRNSLPEATLVFNNVGAWPVEKTMHTPVDAVYIEVWPPYERYAHLKRLVLAAKQANKPVVIAAYPAAFRTAEANAALESQLILMCALHAHGATQLWFGEENTAITQGYYADYSRLTDEQELLLRKYDDFFTRYEELLFDDTLQDVSMTHFGWDNMEYRCNHPCSVNGDADKLWLVIREGHGEKLISVINLCGREHDLWAEGQQAVAVQEDVTITAQIFGKLTHVLVADPETDEGDFQACQFRTVDGERGQEVQITIPKIGRYAMIWIKTEE